MPYRLKAGESVPEGTKRIVLEEIDSATAQLAGKGTKRGEAIHEARKSIKKIRGALRLVQPQLGRTYKSETARLRDVAQKLSELRDAQAVIEIFDDLVKKYEGDLQPSALVSIRRGLQENKREAEQAVQIERVAEQAISMLRSTSKRVKSWPLKKDGFKAIAPGLRKRYRRGRRAMAIARADPTPENYHEWRKRVKDHWYHVRLLENLWTEVMQAYEESLKKLETWLGNDHNLVVLCGKLHDRPERYGEEKDVQLIVALAVQYQHELRENALSLGQRVYQQKPRKLTRDLAALWEAWQQQPRGMKKLQKDQRNAAKKAPDKSSAATARSSAA